MTSFLFSLTEGDKFKLTSKAKAVYHDSNYGPAFGAGHDVVIKDQANTNYSSYVHINFSYKNLRY